MKKSRIAFTIADQNNLKWAKMMERSLRKFHSSEELPLEVITGPVLEGALAQDNQFFYRATPVIASQLIKQYETVIKIDADSVVCTPINEAWEGEGWDVKLVLNSNPREFKKYPVAVWDIHPVMEYVNNGFVSMRSEEFVEHWHKLCYSPHFQNYQMREQDLLNILVHYGNYNCELLENTDQFWGLASKGYWPEIELRGDKLILPANQEWNKNDRVIKVLHAAGGNTPNKWNFNIQFEAGVAKWLSNLTKEEN